MSAVYQLEGVGVRLGAAQILDRRLAGLARR